MNSLAWLHLSDWHQQGPDFDREAVRYALLEDLEQRERLDPRLARIDFIVFSGDLAFGGSPAEYASAGREFLDPILDRTGVPKERLFLVPGNHDFRRPALKYLAPPLFQSEEEVNELLLDAASRETVFSPMRAYSDFVRSYLGKAAPEDEDPCHGYLRPFEVDSLPVALVGMNSAWMCARHEELDPRTNRKEVRDQGYLLLGEPQFSPFVRTSPFRAARVRIGVLHHPIDWLDKGLSRWPLAVALERHFHFLLRGHEHASLAACRCSGPHGSCVTIAGGAAYDRREYPNGYNLVLLDLDLDPRVARGTIFFRRYDEGRGFHEDTVAAGGATSGRYVFELPEGIRAAAEPPRSPVVPAPRQPLPTDEFAIELLTEPLILARTATGAVRVTVRRDHVCGHIYTTAAKRDLSRTAFSTPELLAEGHRLDREIHQFLLGGSTDPSLIVPLDDLPLRWASGGVLSVVRWQGALWTPFFFRDIPPYGWNIALGSSEESDDLNDPWTFLWREFLEETLVLRGEPLPGTPIGFKRFVVERLDVADEMRRAAQFATDHIKARRLADGLMIESQRDLSPILDADYCVAARIARAPGEILISKGSTQRLLQDVLLAINILELGIEVVKVVEYELEPRESILDGETLVSDAGKHLVRMPVALISHAYLSRVFLSLPLHATPPTEIQPTIEAPPIPADELHLYPFDALRRRDLAQRLDDRASAWERERYGEWMRRFGKLFFDATGRLHAAHGRAWFTPATAKILSYYFASRLSGQRSS